MKRAIFINDKKSFNCQTESASTFSQKAEDNGERLWWEKLNPKCLKCQRNCKQSAKAEILCCPQYQVMEATNGKS